MKTYTVIGIYSDTHQRYADSYDAKSPKDAERQAKAAAGGTLEIAGVLLEGDGSDLAHGFSAMKLVA